MRVRGKKEHSFTGCNYLFRNVSLRGGHWSGNIDFLMNQPESQSLHGACHCGAVSITVPSDAFGIVACHCGDCQKLHGNYFAMLAVDRAAVVWSGEASIRWYDSSAKARRAFCSHCGSRLAKDPQGSPKVLVSVGLFPKDLARRLAKHVYSELKPDWYDLPALATP